MRSREDKSQARNDEIPHCGEPADCEAIVQMLRNDFLADNDPKNRQGEITQDFISRGLSGSTAHVSAQMQARIDFINSLVKWLVGSLEAKFGDIPLFEFRDQLLGVIDKEYAKIPPVVNVSLVQAGLAAQNRIEQYKQKIDEEANNTKKRIQTHCAISEKRSAQIERATTDNRPTPVAEMNPDTRTDRFIKNIKNHPVISFLIIGGIIIVALGAVAGGMDNIVSLWNKLVHKHPESSVPLQDIMDTSIVSVTATVEVTITSDRSGVKNHIMPGTYVAFAKDGQALLVMSSMTCRSEQKGNNSVLYSSTLSMEPGNEAFDKPLSFFKQADYIQVCLKPIPARSRILSGRVVCVFNDVIPLEIQIPSQEMVSDVIAIRDIGMALEMQLKAQPNR